MKYLIVGKRAAELNMFQRLLSESNKDDEFEICDNVSTLVKQPDTKLIYIYVSIPVSWNWEFEGQLDVHSDDTRFLDELMDFREFDEKTADIKVEYDGSQITSVVQEIQRKIGDMNEKTDCCL